MSDGPTEVKLIAVIQKQRREQLRIALRTYPDSSRVLDCRVFEWFRGAASKATGRGFSLRPAQIREFIDALLKAEEAAISEGLLDSREDISARLKQIASRYERETA